MNELAALYDDGNRLHCTGHFHMAGLSVSLDVVEPKKIPSVYENRQQFLHHGWFQVPEMKDRIEVADIRWEDGLKLSVDGRLLVPDFEGKLTAGNQVFAGIIDTHAWVFHPKLIELTTNLERSCGQGEVKLSWEQQGKGHYQICSYGMLDSTVVRLGARRNAGEYPIEVV